MPLNLKNLIKGGAQKARFAVKRKEPQISVRITETKNSNETKNSSDLIVGPVWSGDHQAGVNQIEIQIKLQLPPEHKLKITLVDNQSDWPIKALEFSGSSVANMQVVTGAQNLNLKFQLRTKQGQLPKIGITYYIKEININNIFNRSVEPLKRSIVVEKLITDTPMRLPEKLQIDELEPLLRWYIDPRPVRQLFVDSIDLEDLEDPEDFTDSDETESDSDSESESDSPSINHKLLQLQTEWDQLQLEIKDLVEDSQRLAQELFETETKQQLNTFGSLGSLNSADSMNDIPQFLHELEILNPFIKRLKLELHQIEIVLTIHQGRELNESLKHLLQRYSQELSKEVLKINLLIDSLNLKLEKLVQAYHTEIESDQAVQKIKQLMNELSVAYQAKIKVGHGLLKTRQKLLIEPVVSIHRKLITRLT